MGEEAARQLHIILWFVGDEGGVGGSCVCRFVRSLSSVPDRDEGQARKARERCRRSCFGVCHGATREQHCSFFLLAIDWLDWGGVGLSVGCLVVGSW